MVHRKFTRAQLSRRGPWRPRTRPVRREARYKKGAKAVKINSSRGYWIAPRVSTKLIYEQAQQFHSIAGVSGDYIFRLNSIYDPDLSGGGHQPMGFDQLAALYNRYQVKSVKVKIVGHKETDNVVGVMAFQANNDATSKAAYPISQIKEQPNTTVRYSNFYNTNDKPCTITKTYDLAKVTGVSKTKYMTDDRYQSAFNNNPAEDIIGHLVVNDMLATTGTTWVTNVRIEYNVDCFDPVDYAQS